MSKYSRVDFVDGRKLLNTELNELQEQSILRDRGLLEAIYGVPKGVVKATGTPRANGMVVEATVFAFGSVYTVNQTVNGIYSTSHTTDTDAVIYAEVRATIVTGDQDISLRHPTLAINTANRIQHVVTLKSVVGAIGAVPADVTTGGEVYNVPVMAVKGRFNTNPAIQAGVVKVYGSLLKYVDDRIVGLVDSAPGVLDTLNELSKALGDDPNFATTMTNLIATKLDKTGDMATQSEAEEGSLNKYYMTPLRTKQAIAKNMEALKPTNVTVASPGGTVASSMKSPVNVKRIDGKTIVNQAPLFDSGAWVLLSNTFLVVNSATKISISPQGNVSLLVSVLVQVKPNTTYTLSTKHNGYIGVYNSTGSTALRGYTTNQTTSFNSGANTTVKINLTNMTITQGVITFENVSLVEGSQEMPFVANVKGVTNPTIVNETNGTSLVVPTTLYAGEYVEQNTKGELVKYKKYQEILLDEKLTYAYYTSSANNTAKRINVTAGLTGLKVDASLSSLADHRLVKYNGMVLVHGSTTLADNFNNVDNQLAISIPNADSGWGANYIPTPEEMKAFVLGWRMNIRDGGTAMYDGVGTKEWHKIDGIGIRSGTGTTTVPTTLNDLNFKHYRLIAELATPVLEVIQPYSDLTLEKGANSIKVYAGRIVNADVKPTFYATTGQYYVNGNIPGSKLPYANSSIIGIYRNNQLDKRWDIGYTLPSDVPKYGVHQAVADSWYDPTTSTTIDYEPYYTWEVTAPIDAVQLAYFETLQSVTNEVLAYLEALGSHSARATQLINYLVRHTNEINPHAETSSYTIRVGANQQFKTVQSAVDSIKKNMGGHSITIIIDPGNYMEQVRINGFSNGYIAIYGEANNRLAVTVEHIRVSYCTATIAVHHMLISVPSTGRNGVEVANTVYARMYNVALTTLATGKFSGVNNSNSNVMLEQCDIRFFGNAVHAEVGALTYVANCTGSGNTTGLACYGGAVIAKYGTVPGATTTAESVWAGGVIR